MLTGNFKIDKDSLIKTLDFQLTHSKSKNVLTKIKNELDLIDTHSKISGLISKWVIDELIGNEKIGEQLIEFEKYYHDKTNLINSKVLKRIAKYLSKNGSEITYYGKAWSNMETNWIYFDIVLNIDKLKTKFNWAENVVISENLDLKSGLERGLLDNETGEGLMGKLE